MLFKIVARHISTGELIYNENLSFGYHPNEEELIPMIEWLRPSTKGKINSAEATYVRNLKPNEK